MKTLIYVLLGTLVGVGFLVAVDYFAPQSECVTGRVELTLDGAAIIIGEAVVCGEFHSNIYGPTVAAWDGNIMFYHNHEEE